MARLASDNKTITELFDSLTSEPINGRLITQFPDLTPVTDEDVDNVILFKNIPSEETKIPVGYTLRSNWNDIKYSNILNSTYFIKSVNNINKLGGGRVVVDKMITINSSITIPVNVTLEFMNGGGLTVNLGVTLTINSFVETGNLHIFYGDGSVVLNGNSEVYPTAFGALMDNVTDDWAAFQKTKDCVAISPGAMVVKRKLFLNIAGDISKIIIIDDNTDIRTEGSGAIVVNNVFIPAFIWPLSQNCTFDVNLIFRGQYDASQYAYFEGTSGDTKGTRFNNTIYKNFLIQRRGITFTGSYNPRALTYSSYMATCLVRGGKNINFGNTSMTAEGNTANKFIIWAFKFVPERPRNTVINSTTAGTYTVCENIIAESIKLDGVIMGIQGGGKNISINSVIGERYSDVQNENGTFVGGYNYNGSGTYWMAPPHLVYLNDDAIDLSIGNIIDKGYFVGVTRSRPTLDSGYYNTLKLKGTRISVNDLTSYRQDGALDLILGSIDVSIGRLFSKYDSAIFPANSTFSSVRFPSEANDDGVTDQNPLLRFKMGDVTIIDDNPLPIRFPIAFINRGNSVVIENMNIYIQDFNSLVCAFYVNGDNNKITYTLNIANHQQVTDRVFQMNVNSVNANIPIGRQNMKNNKYDIEVRGWRDISNTTTFDAKKGRITLVSADNPNSNELRINDVTNKLETVQKDLLKTETWTRSQFITAPVSGNAVTLTINVPAGWIVKSLAITTTTAFGASGGMTSLALGTTTGGSQYLGDIPLTVDSTGMLTTTKDFVGLDTPSTTNRIIRLSAIGGNFDGTGAAKVVFNLSRTIQGE